MSILKALHITRLYFILFGACIILHVLSGGIPILYAVSLIGLIVLHGFLCLDIILTFSLKEPIHVKRTLHHVMNLGDDNEVSLLIENASNQPVQLFLQEGYPVEMQVRNEEKYYFLNAGETKKYRYRFKPTKRGDYFFDDVHIYLSSILHLCKRKIVIPQKDEVQVYPSILQMKHFELKVFHQQTRAQGIKKIRRIGHNNEFEQIKNYVQGDELRTINWKATSKKNELMVNQYQEERSQNVYCVIDKSRTMQLEFEQMTLLDYAINASLVFSNIAIKKGDRAGLITFSNKIGSQLVAERNTNQLRRILHLLYNQKTHFKEASYELLYESIHQTVKTRSLLMLFTNFESEFAMRRALPMLKKLNQKHVLVVVLFQNNEMEEVAYQRMESLEHIYLSTVAEKMINVKASIARELQKHSIQTILTRPEELTISTINKYLELKSKGVI